jgi:hypothetical protein
MKPAPPRFHVADPLSLVLHKGHIGIWSRNAAADTHFVALDLAELALLRQFSSGPQEPERAAASAGLDPGAALGECVRKLVYHHILSEHPPADDVAFHLLNHPEGERQVCLVEPQVIGPDAVRSIAEGIRNSGLVGDNPLSQGFSGTRGFGVRFRREAHAQLLEWLPWARPFFKHIFDESVARYFASNDGAHISWPNAFYLNALLIQPGAGTGLHVDRTLDSCSPACWVSVLYVETVPPPGGRLFLYDGTWPVGMLNPRPGMIIHFSGHLRHGVSETQPTDPERVSIVCEQYVLADEALERCPYIELIRTRA